MENLLITLGTWNPQAAESNIRDFLSTLIFIIVALNVIRRYAAGRKGAAVGEGLVGSALAIFVKYPDVLSKLGDWVKTTLGF